MRVQTKLILSIFPVLLTGFVALSFLTYTTAKNVIQADAYSYIEAVLEARYEQTLGRRAELLRSSKMDKVESFLRLYQQEAIDDLSLGSDSRYGCFAVFDTLGRKVHSAGDCSTEPLLSQLRKGALEALEAPSHESRGLVEVAKPRLMGARAFAPWKWVLVYSTETSRLEQAIHRALLWNIALASLCVAACALVIVLVFRRVFGEPVARLKAAAARIAHSEPNVFIEVKSKDELGSLSISLNEMSLAISNSIAGLQRLKGDLESSNAAMALEIADRRKAQAELKDAHDKLAATFRSIPDLLFELDGEGRIFDYHLPEGEALYVEASQFLGKTVSEVLPQSAAEAIMTALEQAAVHGWHRGAIYQLDLSAGQGWFELSIAAKGTQRGAKARYVATVRNITERKAAEAERANLEVQLHQAQKLESIGRLAGGVAHDFNNMLGVILGRTDLALLDTGLKAQPREAFEEIRRVAERSAELARQLLTFARKQTVVPKVLDLNEVVVSTRQMLQRLIGENICIDWSPATSLWPVLMDPSQIVQILTNLCVNARDAIAIVGNITIETMNFAANDEFCAAHAGVVSGDYVQLKVRDDGHGMDEETLNHVFEPFFTTKGVGEGTGLGLATVYGIVQQSRGFIVVMSDPGKGTTFNILLPRHMGEDEPTKSLAPKTDDARAHETILLVEDEPALRTLIERMLEKLGYEVLSASHSAQALLLVAGHAQTISLLLTDVVMPEMNGRDLAAKIQALCPKVKILFMSGYTANVIASHGALDEGMHFLQKPFSLEKLAHTLREVLAS
ncbi:MAG: response regulator [Myxococcota bacterium]|jgi:signal transduction histidine kinase|nr:response regulator [Myxococcota bacterium]